MRPETGAHDGLLHLAQLPDLDGDGSRDLVTISSFVGRAPSSSISRKSAEPPRVYVDAISGKDGRSLWYWYLDNGFATFAQSSRPLLWGRGPDGWPLLAVAIPQVHLLELSSGRELQTLTGLTKPNLADLDGDGLADIWGEVKGQIRAFRGEAPEAWRALGRFQPRA